MKLEKITLGKRVWATTARNKENERRGTVTAINKTATGHFIEIKTKDGTTFQTRPALVR